MRVSSAATPERDRAELPCERCGYSSLGLAPESLCPECGMSFEESVRMRAAGSPWQQKQAARAWLQTVAIVCIRPRRTLARVSFVKDDQNYSLFLCNVLIPPLVLWLVIGVIALSFMLSERQRQPFELIVGLIGLAAAALVTLLAWFWIAFLAVSGAQGALRVLSSTRCVARRGGSALACHATCVFVPCTAVFAVSLASQFVFPSPAPLAVFAAALVWFGVVCLVGTSRPAGTRGEHRA